MSPTPIHVQAAQDAALKLTGDDTTRARLVALAALRAVFGRVQVKELAALVGFAVPKDGVTALRKARQFSNWWREDWVDEIVGELVSDRYGARAQ